MNLFGILKGLGLVFGALLFSLLLAYFTTELYIYWYAKKLGMTEKELVDDYGLAFDVLQIGGATVFVTLIACLLAFVFYRRKASKP